MTYKSSLAAYGTGINLLPIPETQAGKPCTELLILATHSTGGAVGLGGASITQYTINSTSASAYPSAPLTVAWTVSAANFSSYSAAAGFAYSLLPSSSSSAPNLIVQYGPPLNAINCPCDTAKCTACVSNSTIEGYYLS